jgi:hypothetical protein
LKETAFSIFWIEGREGEGCMRKLARKSSYKEGKTREVGRKLGNKK